ncbi:MAG: sulfite exporter TauE/SafE family protein [Chthonomonadales bacterium]|nr:sulfite exporter TauE/SafE family protein [Chthonomonadales bacterium]
MQQLLTLLFGLLTGLSLGALGSGGSILALPGFVYGAGLAVKPAVATSLLVVGATSLIGALMAWRRCAARGCPGQEADPRAAALFAAGGVGGAFAGARAGSMLPDAAQMALFTVAVLAAAVGMYRRASRQAAADTVEAPRRPIAPLPLALLGGGVGLLTGAVGVGGGFLIVPALTLAAGMPVKRAIATSLWVITANAATGSLGYHGRVPVAWGFGALFLLASAVGMALGQRLARGARPRGLQRAFALFLVLVGLASGAQTYHTRQARRAAARHVTAAPR